MQILASDKHIQTNKPLSEHIYQNANSGKLWKTINFTKGGWCNEAVWSAFFYFDISS